MRKINVTALVGALMFFSNYSIAGQLTPSFKLISNNGLEWNEVTNIASQLSFSFPRTTYSQSGNQNSTWEVATKIRLYEGDCQNSSCGTSSNPILFSRDNLNTENFWIGPLSPNIVFGPTGFFSSNALTDACNSELHTNGIYTDRQIKKDFQLTLHVIGNRTFAGPLFPEPVTTFNDSKRLVNFEASIFCESLGENPGAITANELKVFLATNTNAITQPSAGTECPMTKFTTRIKTNRAGTLPVHTYRQIGIGPIVKKEKDILSVLQADGSFVGRFEEWVSVNQSSVVRVKAEEVDNPYALNDINLSTQWKDISLVCAGAGGAGLSGLSPGGSTDPDAPSTQAGSVSLNALPNNTGGGAPTGLSDKSQKGQKTAYEYKLDGVMISSYDVSGASDGAAKTPLGGLRSDGELVQAKKPRGLIGHELTHTQSRVNKGAEKLKEPPVLASNPQTKIAAKNSTAVSHSDLYIKSLSVAGGKKLKAKNAKGYENGACLFEINYTVGHSVKGNKVPEMATLSNLTLKRGTTVIKRHVKQDILKNKQKRYKELLPLVEGSNTLTLTIDSENKVKESNENNNKKTVAVNVSGSCKGK